MKCFFCGSEATGQCTECQRFYCNSHGDTRCQACVSQQRIAQREAQEHAAANQKARVKAERQSWIDWQQKGIWLVILATVGAMAIGSALQASASPGSQAEENRTWVVLTIFLGASIFVSSIIAMFHTREWRRDSSSMNAFSRMYVYAHSYPGLAALGIVAVVSVVGIIAVIIAALGRAGSSQAAGDD